VSHVLNNVTFDDDTDTFNCVAPSLNTNFNEYDVSDPLNNKLDGIVNVYDDDTLANDDAFQLANIYDDDETDDEGTAHNV